MLAIMLSLSALLPAPGVGRPALAAREEAPPGLGEEPVLLGRRRAPLVLVVEPAIGTAASKLR